MSAFYAASIERLTELLDRNDGIFIVKAGNLVSRIFPGYAMSDLRAICERALADGIIAGYGHSTVRGTGSNRLIGIAAPGAPALSGFRPGFNTLPDNATCYVALHPDHEGRAVVAKFGRTNDPKGRRHALFPHSQRLLPEEEMHTLDSANATQVEQIMRLAFSMLTVGGRNRQILEYVRAPHFEGDVTRNIGANARNETINLMIAAMQTANLEISTLETIDRHDPAQRVQIANRLVRRLATQFKVRTVRTEAGHLSFAR